MGKLPSFQFYPADWRKDPGVQSLTFHQRGVWLEILCLMHESPSRGVLLLPNGKTMSDDALCRVIGLDKQNLTTTLTSLLEFGVASREPETGALMNRRMVRDEELRKTRQKCGKMGGNPNLLNQTPKQNPTTQVKQNPTPSSSSSSSTSVVGAEEDPPDELLTVEQAKQQALMAGVDPDFAAYVFADWHARNGCDAGGVKCQFIRLAKKRWTREQIEWNAKTHRGNRQNGNHSSKGGASRVNSTHDPDGKVADQY